MKTKLLISLLSITFFLSCGEPLGEGEGTDGIALNQHRIFVTSTSTNGNMGGLSGADTICATRATSVGLVRTYKAFLGDSSNSIKSRFNLSGAVLNVNSSDEKITIVDLGVNLFDADSTNLENNIEFDENGDSVTQSVWTGSDSEGEISTSQHCSDWSSNSAGSNGSIGDNTRTTGFWLEDPPTQACNQNFRIYCLSI